MVATLRSETFAARNFRGSNREIIVFRGNKLSRIRLSEKFARVNFRGRRKNEGKIFFIIRILSILYNSTFWKNLKNSKKSKKFRGTFADFLKDFAELTFAEKAKKRETAKVSGSESF